MKLWIIIYIAGKIGMSIGPVPYGMAQCRELISNKNQEIQDRPDELVNGRSIHDVVLKCEWHETRPPMDLE